MLLIFHVFMVSSNADVTDFATKADIVHAVALMGYLSPTDWTNVVSYFLSPHCPFQLVKPKFAGNVILFCGSQILHGTTYVMSTVATHQPLIADQNDLTTV